MPWSGPSEEGTVIEIISDGDEVDAGGGPASQRTHARRLERQQVRSSSCRRQRRSIPIRFRPRAASSHEVPDVIDLTAEPSQGADEDDDVQAVGTSTPVAKRKRKGSAAATGNGKADSGGNAGASLKCPVCLDYIKDMTSTMCGHVFCQGCIKLAVKSQKKCPTCRKAVTSRGLHRIYLS